MKSALASAQTTPRNELAAFEADRAGRVVGRKSGAIEVSPAEACVILNCGRATLQLLLDQRFAGKIIVWRWLNENKRKRLFDRQSLLDYVAATRDPEFADAQQKR